MAGSLWTHAEKGGTHAASAETPPPSIHRAVLIRMTVHLTLSADLMMAGRCSWLKADSAVPVNALPCVNIHCTLETIGQESYEVILTIVDHRGEQVVDPMHPDVDGEEKAH